MLRYLEQLFNVAWLTAYMFKYYLKYVINTLNVELLV
jgi:hypothetical protein